MRQRNTYHFLGRLLGPVDLCCMILRQFVRDLDKETQLKCSHLHESALMQYKLCTSAHCRVGHKGFTLCVHCSLLHPLNAEPLHLRACAAISTRTERTKFIQQRSTGPSYHLKKLEAQLQVKLLNRSTRSISLTQAGQAYYERCHAIAEQANAANQQIENVKNEAIGLIKITCPVNVGLQTIVPALNEFKKIYPKIELDVMLTDEVVDIIKGGIDLAIRGAPLPDSGLQATKLATLETCLCGSPDYFLQYGIPITPADLTHHHWVIYKLTSGVITATKGGRSFSIITQGDIKTNNAAARTAFVEAGHGLARIPIYDAGPKIRTGTLQAVLGDYVFDDINVYGVFPPGTTSSKKLRLLLNFLKEYFTRQTKIPR